MIDLRAHRTSAGGPSVIPAAVTVDEQFTSGLPSAETLTAVLAAALKDHVVDAPA